MEKQTLIRLTNGHLEGHLTEDQIQRLGLGEGATFRAEVEDRALKLTPVIVPSDDDLIEDARDFMRRYRSTFERLAQ